MRYPTLYFFGVGTKKTDKVKELQRELVDLQDTDLLREKAKAQKKAVTDMARNVCPSKELRDLNAGANRTAEVCEATKAFKEKALKDESGKESTKTLETSQPKRRKRKSTSSTKAPAPPTKRNKKVKPKGQEEGEE